MTCYVEDSYVYIFYRFICSNVYTSIVNNNNNNNNN